jgi:hypothetical protein
MATATKTARATKTTKPKKVAAAAKVKTEAPAAAFARHLTEWDARARGAMGGEERLAGRLRVSLGALLAIGSTERDVLSRAARTVLDTESDDWLFGAKASRARKVLVAHYRTVATTREVPGDMRDLVAFTLVSLHIGLLVRLVHDRSKGSAQTRALVDVTVDLAPTLAILFASPFAVVARKKILKGLLAGGVLPPELAKLARG